MAKGKGGASGFGTGDNVHSGSGSKGKGKSTGTASVSAHDGGSGYDTHTSAGGTEKTHNVEFAKGGNTPMFGEQAAESETKNGMAGHTADPSAKDSAPGEKFADGGKTKMFGFNAAKTATSGITSAY